MNTKSLTLKASFLTTALLLTSLGQSAGLLDAVGENLSMSVLTSNFYTTRPTEFFTRDTKEFSSGPNLSPKYKELYALVREDVALHNQSGHVTPLLQELINRLAAEGANQGLTAEEILTSLDAQ